MQHQVKVLVLNAISFGTRMMLGCASYIDRYDQQDIELGRSKCYGCGPLGFVAQDMSGSL